MERIVLIRLRIGIIGEPLCIVVLVVVLIVVVKLIVSNKRCPLCENPVKVDKSLYVFPLHINNLSWAR